MTCTEDYALGTLNPFRYRSYYYDIETGLYYLNSRYYDPEIGRFINADGLLAGADEVNLNLFAYCGNTPTCCVDRTGMRYAYGLTASEMVHSPIDELTKWFEKRILRPVRQFVSDIKEDCTAFHLNNTSEEAALSCHYFSAYKGVLVFKTNFSDRSGSFGAIFLSREGIKNDSNPEDVVRHEYGHTKQLKQLGPVKYLIDIGIPSYCNLGTGDYYDRPWEITADLYGGVQSRQHSAYNITQGLLYLDICREIDSPVFLLFCR